MLQVTCALERITGADCALAGVRRMSRSLPENKTLQAKGAVRVHHWAVATQGTVKISERPGQGKDAPFNSDVGDRLATGTKGFSTSYAPLK